MESPKRKQLKVKMKYKKTIDTREKLYHAAMSVMSEKGYQNATIRDICKRANVSPATFYSYYHTKSDILSDLYLMGDTFYLNIFPKILIGKDSLEQLRMFTSSYARLNMSTGLEAMRLLYNPENEWFIKHRPLLDSLLDIVTRGQAEGALTADLCADSLVEYILTLLRGVCYSWCIHNASFDLEERMLEAINLLIQGIAGNRT